MAKKKATNKPVAADQALATIDPAFNQVMTWLLEGHTEQDIRESIAQRYPQADATALLTAVLDHFAKVGEADKDVLRGWVLEAYRELYRRMVEMGDFPNALKAVKELQRIAGA